MLELVKSFCLSALGGFLLSLIDAPLPWMLGPVIVTAYRGYRQRKRIACPLWVREIAQLPLGYAMGRSFTAETALLILQALPFMLLAAALTVGAGLASAWQMKKHSDIDLTSCLLGCVHGGFSQMVLLADEMPWADLTAVTILQTARMLSAVAVIPDADVQAAVAAAPLPPAEWPTVGLFALLAVMGMIVAKLLHIPAASLIGPILATGAYLIAAGGTAPAVPRFWLSIAQIGIGTYIGAGIDAARLHDYRDYWGGILEGIVIVLGASMLTALGICQLTGVGITTAFLGCAPGGITEMGVTALAVGANSAMMTAYQMARLLFIMLAYPLIVRRIVAWKHNPL